MHSHTWHRDSHGLFDYESKNVSQNYIKCNYSGTPTLTMCDTFLVLMRRFDNDIIFEEMNQRADMDQFADCVIGNMAAVVLEKQGKSNLLH